MIPPIWSEEWEDLPTSAAAVARRLRKWGQQRLQGYAVSWRQATERKPDLVYVWFDTDSTGAAKARAYARLNPEACPVTCTVEAAGPMRADLTLECHDPAALDVFNAFKEWIDQKWSTPAPPKHPGGRPPKYQDRATFEHDLRIAIRANRTSPSKAQLARALDIDIDTFNATLARFQFTDETLQKLAEDR